MDPEVLQHIEDVNHADGPVFFELLGISYMIEQVWVEDKEEGVVNVYADARKYPYRAHILMKQWQFLELVKIDPTLWEEENDNSD